jgi:hypothetical protein
LSCDFIPSPVAFPPTEIAVDMPTCHLRHELGFPDTVRY